MRCLFCRMDTESSRSVEHIVPQSLGNLSHTLPPGVVCDRCNNYFATKVEKPFLECAAMTLLRFHQEIPSKRGRVPPIPGVLHPGFPAILRRHPGSGFVGSADVPPEAFAHILRQHNSMLILPAGAELPSGPIASRFLAKAAMEGMAARLVRYPGGLKYLVEESQLDPLRNHARRGDNREWPFHSRQIYDANTKWIDEAGVQVQVVHEFDILQTDWGEWFFVLALFGLELVINYGGPEIDGYKRWLSENKEASPLYFGKNSSGWPLPFSG
jgi:hypothetical protein